MKFLENRNEIEVQKFEKKNSVKSILKLRLSQKQTKYTKKNNYNFC